ncbi:hypothetical protein [Spongiactinospora gelatinilytica]|uniref:hypothetical protein n=1 Tax=Spongiactinospora gelatinilytica TaxID=2666298 RepID=UPI001F443A05|nr:hypothetical protein [Spongiactinospora gelatinilytica]
MGLAHRGDLPGFGEPGRDAHIHAGVVDQVRFHQALELPLGAELLARDQRYRWLRYRWAHVVAVRAYPPQDGR